MSYEEKIEEARRVLDAHNAALSENEGNKVNIDRFLTSLKVNGGTSVEGLRSCSFEDLESFGLPRLLARNIATMFRKWNGEERQSPAYISPKKAAQMALNELVLHYDPRDPENPVGQRLSALAHHKPFIVFNDDGSVNVEDSITLLDEVRDGHSPRSTLVVGDRPRPVYAVGERPDEMADENPLFPGEVLRTDGTCDRTQRNWKDVSHVVRVLLRLAVHDTKEIVIRSLDDAHDKIELATNIGGTAEAVIRVRYPQASILYDRLSTVGQVPSLKVRRGGRNSERQNDPFAATGNANRRF